MRHKLLACVMPVMLVTACTSVEPEPAVCPSAPEVVCPICPPVQQCPAPVPRTPSPPVVQKAGELQLPIIGAIEWASIEPGELRMEARIDTGADTTSIHAENIRLLERDGKRYVRFDLENPDSAEPVAMELRLRRRVLIKQHNDEPERRYVVRMWITLGDLRARVDVNLTDREVFEYPLLIGRNFLTDNVIVDVSQHHLLGR